MKIWIDGKLVDKEQACVNVFDHGLLYGDGVFEGIRVYNGRIFECKAHVERLFESAREIRLTVPLTREQVVDAMYQTIKANALTDCYIRLVVTRGVGSLGLNPKECKKPTVFVIADQIALYPKEMYEKGLPVIVAKHRRISSDMLPPRVKSLNYLNNILARIEALDAGVGEAIMLNADGQVAECTGDNIFMIRQGTVLTPPPSAGILIGVTRGVVMRLCGKLGIPIKEQVLSVEDVYAADELFLTGTAAEVIAVTRVDEKVIGSGKAGPLTTKLLNAFRAYIAAGEFE